MYKPKYKQGYTYTRGWLTEWVTNWISNVHIFNIKFLLHKESFNPFILSYIRKTKNVSEFLSEFVSDWSWPDPWLAQSCPPRSPPAPGCRAQLSWFIVQYELVDTFV